MLYMHACVCMINVCMCVQSPPHPRRQLQPLASSPRTSPAPVPTRSSTVSVSVAPTGLGLGPGHGDAMGERDGGGGGGGEGRERGGFTQHLSPLPPGLGPLSIKVHTSLPACDPFPVFCVCRLRSAGGRCSEVSHWAVYGVLCDMMCVQEEIALCLFLFVVVLGSLDE